jgi:hypothetical protein
VTTTAHSTRDPLGYYTVLGVSPDATDAEIRRAHRREARRWHPDWNGGPEAHERMASINEAFATLGDPRHREAYDRGAAAGRHEPEPPRPVVEPATVDFGSLRPGERAMRTVRVENKGGPCATVRIEPELGTWFRVAGARGGSSPEVVAELDLEAFAEPGGGLGPGEHTARVAVLLDDERAELDLHVTVLGASGAGAAPGDPLAASSPPGSAALRYVDRKPLWERLGLAAVTGVAVPSLFVWIAAEHAGANVALILGGLAMMGLAGFAATKTYWFTDAASASPAGQWAAAVTLWLGKASLVLAVIALVVFVVLAVLAFFLALALVAIVFSALVSAVSN